MTRGTGPDTAKTQAEHPARGARAFVPRLGLPGYVYDLIVFAGLAGVGAAFALGALTLEDGDRVINAGTVPAVTGTLLVVLSVVGAVQAIRARGEGPDVEIVRPFQVFLAMGLVLIFPPAIDRFGYYLTAILWVPAFVWAAGARNWTAYLIVLASVLILARFVFEMILGTPLP